MPRNMFDTHSDKPSNSFKTAFVVMTFMMVALTLTSLGITSYPVSSLGQQQGQIQMYPYPQYQYMEPSPRQCLSFDNEMDELVAKSNQIYLVMLPKAAGTTALNFAKECSPDANIPNANFLNMKTEVRRMFEENLKPPTIIASHLYNGDNTLRRLIKQSTKDALIIFLHREETDRVKSSVKMIVEDWLCGGKAERLPKSSNKIRAANPDFQVEGDTCIFQESSLIDPLITERYNEIGDGNHKVLSCAVYDDVEEHAPNLVFMNFKQLNKLQTVLAKHHCPELLPRLPLHKNVASEKKDLDIQIQLMHENEVGEFDKVPFTEWLDAKMPAMEWALNMKNDASCQAKTRRIESDLSYCPDRMLQVSSANFSPLAARTHHGLSR